MSETIALKLNNLVLVDRPITYGIVQPGPDISPDGIPLIRGKDYSSGIVSTEGLYHVLPEIDKPYSRSKVNANDILLSIVGYVGKVAVVPQALEGANITQTTARLSINPSIALPKYVFHLLNSPLFSTEVRRYEKGSAQPGLNLGDVGKFSIIFISSKNKQEKIAKVLDTIDQAIEKTESLIEKYQHIKAGLMHDLFTRGIGADGKLRPPREQAPELYQQTPIGWIPKEWRLEACGSLCTRICVGIVIQPTQYYVEEGIPAFRSANIRENGIDSRNFVFISPAANKILVKSQIKAGDILSVRTGYPGTSAVVPQEYQGANTIDILISTPGDLIDSGYLCDWINSSFGKGQVLRQQGGMAQQHFNVGEMRELLVALPSKEEQLRVRSKANSLNKRLRVEKALLEKLKQQKLGLMQDLLTAKVAVKIQPENSPESEAMI